MTAPEAEGQRRVFLIGAGPLPIDDPIDGGFPALRSWQFLRGLLADGHDVCFASLVPRDLAPATPAGPREVRVVAGGRHYRLHRCHVHAEEPGRFLALRDLRREWNPDVTVTAGPFLPMGGGARAAGDEPLWVDVPGDPMSEAQARAFRGGSHQPILRYREMLAFALARGDAFSVISGSQRGVLLGALGLHGRLTAPAIGHELVHVLPASVHGVYDDVVSQDGARVEGPALPFSGRDFAVLFCGGYNTWLDADALLDGLIAAMDRDPRIHFVSTGGSLRGHEESTYRSVRERAARSVHRDRMHFLGWVRSSALPAVYRACDLALCVDLPCYEAEFGTRTRVLDALEQGLPVASTVFCDLTRDLLQVEGFHPLPASSPQAIADLLVQLSAARGFRSESGHSARSDVVGAGSDPPAGGAVPWSAVRGRYSLAATTATLRAWVRNPSRSPAGVPVDFLEDQWVELARLQDRLEEVWKSPTWRYLGRAHALIKRIRDP